MRVELDDQNHPVNELARMSADDNNLRLNALNKIRKFVKEHPDIEVFGYHDMVEFNFYQD